MKRVIKSDKPITSVFHVKLQKCDFGVEPRCRLFATLAGKGLMKTRDRITEEWVELREKNSTKGLDWPEEDIAIQEESGLKLT
jgi:hypothetical protein